MRLLVVNFSISNGGDFLIEERMNSLIKRTWPDANVDNINGTISSWKDCVNSYDAVIGGGGPYYDDRIAKDLLIPFFSEPLNSGMKIHLIGSGIYGSDITYDAIYEKKFNADTLAFFHAIEDNGGSFGCRDEISWAVMKNNGFSNVYMTGCPAWYDFSFINKTENISIKTIKKIMVSDPGVTKNSNEQEIRAGQAIEVLKCIKTTFPHACVEFSFNNGIQTKYSHVCNNLIRKYLSDSGITYYDLSNDASKFEVYNDADLHIGFRVHSHIYSLSRRIPSILIEEDLRGYGMNETLGLPHLLSFDHVENHMSGLYRPNKYLFQQLKDVMRYYCETDFSRYIGTWHLMKNMYYKNWKEYAMKMFGSV